MLTLDAGAKRRLKLLAGKLLEINLQGRTFIQKNYCLFTENQVQLKSFVNQPADMVITGSPRAFLKLALSQDLRLATRLGLTFEGDPIALEAVQQLFFSLNIDWEEALSKYTGDIIAHQLGQFSRYARKKQQEILTNASRSVAEYLQEESEVLPTHTEINHFLNGVDELRASIDRIEARMAYISLARNKDNAS